MKLTFIVSPFSKAAQFKFNYIKYFQYISEQENRNVGWRLFLFNVQVVKLVEVISSGDMLYQMDSG